RGRDDEKWHIVFFVNKEQSYTILHKHYILWTLQLQSNNGDHLSIKKSICPSILTKTHSPIIFSNFFL
ncbi:hypothetical protein ACJX0J_033515, partial [Zea mays]